MTVPNSWHAAVRGWSGRRLDARSTAPHARSRARRQQSETLPMFSAAKLSALESQRLHLLVLRVGVRATCGNKRASKRSEMLEANGQAGVMHNPGT